MATRDWVQVARSFASSIQAAREHIEQQRRVPSDLIRAMADAGLFRLSTPRMYGGEEASFITLARTIEELSRADGSVGCTVLIGNNNCYHAGYVPEASAAEIYGGDTSAIVAGSGFARHAVAKPVRGGNQLTGRWGLATGCPEASCSRVPHRFFATLIPGPHRAQPQRQKCTCSLYPSRGPARLVGPLWRDTVLGVAAHALAAVSLGIARAAIDELTRLAVAKMPNFTSRPLRDRPTIQAELAQAEALVRSARSFFDETFEDVWQTACHASRPRHMR